MKPRNIQLIKVAELLVNEEDILLITGSPNGTRPFVSLVRISKRKTITSKLSSILKIVYCLVVLLHAIH